MGEYVIKMTDIGEGVAEAELVEWLVNEGESVREDDVLAAVMTDKATVEIPSPVSGKVLWTGPGIGDLVAVGSPLIKLEVEGDGNVVPGTEDESETIEKAPAVPAQEAKPKPQKVETEGNKGRSGAAPKPASNGHGGKLNIQASKGLAPLAAPAVRKRALDRGLDLRRIFGSGPAGRITHEDIDHYIASGGRSAVGSSRAPNTSIDEIKVVGLRRKIAEQVSHSKSHIPHITYVEEIDVTQLEMLRAKLNEDRREDQPKLSILPFLMRAMVRAIADYPQVNAIYDEEENVVYRHGGVHCGIATQTKNGLVVSVVRHAEALGVWESATEVSRLAEAAREGTIGRDDLNGSTITITSLGALGGIATTPVINHPEVAIIGVNKIQTLPKWDGAQFVPRQVMNLSSSFDHRIIDGWDAAVFVQRIKSLLETPATIFIEE